MKRIIIISGLLWFILFPAVFSQQKTWTLEECVKHAIDNNIQIKQQYLQTEYQKNTLDLSKLKLLPTLNGQVGHTFSFARTLDNSGSTPKYVQNSMYDQINLGGSTNLFSGLQYYNTIKKNTASLLASQQDLENIKDNIALNVALGYLQILLNKELVSATDQQLQISLQQIEKTRKLVEAGSSARGNLLQIESQAAQEEVQLINLKNQLDISYLTLTQLLELQTPAGFEIVTPEISIDTNSLVTGNIDEIFAVAQKNRPEIKSSELKLSASEYDLKIAKGGRIPSINVGHGFSTAFYNTSPASFTNQLSDHKNYYVGFNLNVPILNGWQINKGISNAKIEIQNSQYALEGTKKQLYKNIQQAYADAVAALKKYNASIKAVTSSEESFRYTEQKFNVGLVTPVDYNTSKNQLLKAQSDLAQAKYEFIFKTKVLDFYKGIPISLPK